MNIAAIVLLALAASRGMAQPPALPQPPPPRTPNPESERLAIGTPAPSISGVQWVKGAGPGQWTDGTIYVLDVTGLDAPVYRAHRLRALAQAHEGRVVVATILAGASAEDAARLASERGAAFHGPIGRDVGDVAATYQRALVFPAAHAIFIVDGHGKLAWCGTRVRGAERAVEDLLAGAFDAGRFARGLAASDRIEDALEQRKARAAAELARGLTKDDPRYFSHATLAIFEHLLAGNDTYEALRYGDRALGDELKDDQESCEAVARRLIESSGRWRPGVELAQKAARQADALAGGKDPLAVFAIGRTFAGLEDYPQAIATVERAIEMTPAWPPRMREFMQTKLAQYREIAARAAPGNPAAPAKEAPGRKKSG